jgi:hypothetical protein
MGRAAPRRRLAPQNHRRFPRGHRAPPPPRAAAPQGWRSFRSSVNYLTLGRRKIWEPYFAKLTRRRRGDTNAHRDRYRRRGRDWPDLVDRSDVRVDPRGQRGLGRVLINRRAVSAFGAKRTSREAAACFSPAQLTQSGHRRDRSPAGRRSALRPRMLSFTSGSDRQAISSRRMRSSTCRPRPCAP